MPPGFSVQATAGTLGRFGIDASETCPAGTIRREQATRTECTYHAGAYIYAPRGFPGALVAASEVLPGALSV